MRELEEFVAETVDRGLVHVGLGYELWEGDCACVSSRIEKNRWDGGRARERRTHESEKVWCTVGVGWGLLVDLGAFGCPCLGDLEVLGALEAGLR